MASKLQQLINAKIKLIIASFQFNGRRGRNFRGQAARGQEDQEPRVVRRLVQPLIVPRRDHRVPSKTSAIFAPL